MGGVISGTSLFCSCHGTERLADLAPHQGLHVVDGRHGTRHEVRLSERQILERIAGTVEGSAIVTYVRAILS